MTTIEKIVYAITNMQKLEIDYSDGKTVKKYIVCPHLLGKHRQTKNLLLSAYDITSGSVSGWKTFSLSRIKRIELLDDYFEQTSPNYNPKDIRMESIICSLSTNV